MLRQANKHQMTKHLRISSKAFSQNFGFLYCAFSDSSKTYGDGKKVVTSMVSRDRRESSADVKHSAVWMQQTHVGCMLQRL